MTFNPKEWRKLSERQRRAVIRKIEREEKRAKTVMVVMVFILVFALLLSLLAVMSSCPTPQDAAPTGQEYETQAQRKPSRQANPGFVVVAAGQWSGYVRAAIASSRDIALSLSRCSAVSYPRVAEPQRKSLSQASGIRFACGLLPSLNISSASLLLLSASAQPQTITGKAVGVSDGDTITVLDADKRQHMILLEGIDAPDSNQDFGSRAKQSLSDLVFGKTVTVTSSKKDKYGRVLGKVTLDGKNINLEQVNRGMAWFYRFFASVLSREDATAYEQAEASAKKERRGMWADGEPMPPWDFRRSGHPVKAPGAKPPTLSVDSTVVGLVIGNRNSKIYHLPNCPDYSKVSERNRVPFNTEAEAQAAGFRKAKNCPQ